MDLHQGSSYQNGRDVAAIAADLRAEFKRKLAPRGIKASVTIKRYSMGRSITVYVECPFTVLAEPNTCRFTAEAIAVRDEVTAMMDAHRRTESDWQSDYPHTNFHSFVNISE